MTTNELPASYARYTAAQAASIREMAVDAIETMGPDHPDCAAMQRHLGYLNQILAIRNGESTATPTSGPEVEIEVGRKAGSAAANQFGTFQVHAASEKQVGFLHNLIATKDLGDVKVPTTLEGISKKSASALIDQLIDRPAKANTGTHAAAKMASEKQVAFINRLCTERDWAGVIDGIPFDIDTNRPEWIAAVTSQQASKVIDALQAAPRRQVAKADAKPLAAGAYRLADGRIVRVYLGQNSGQMLCQELLDPTAKTRSEAWAYLGKADRFVTSTDHRMTVEECEAASVGTADHGWCCVCGRELDDPKSVARGIGPKCRAKQAA